MFVAVLLFSDGPGAFDIILNLFVGPGQAATINAFWVIDFKSGFVISINYDKMTGIGEVAGTNGAD